MDSIPEMFGQPERQQVPHSKRRLSDTILVAFHQACDLSDIATASDLLHILDFMAMRRPNLPTGKERRLKEILVAAHERLWQIRHAAELTVPTFNSDSVWRPD